MTHYINSAPLMKDGYKVYHPFAYNPVVTHVYGNKTPRFGKHSNTGGDFMVYVGGQYFCLEVLTKQWNEKFFKQPKGKVICEYSRVVNAMLGKTVKVSHLEKLHDLGYLPLEIKALPEGTKVPYGVPCLTIQNTIEGFGWLTNMVETVMSAEIWGISTSATTAYHYRKNFEDVVEETGLDREMIPFLGHDFSYRGMFGTQAAAMSGFGHLTSFAGSDTIPAALFAEEYYGAKIDQELVFASVDATEHSVMCSYGNEGEMDSLEHLMDNVTPTGILSVVSDTWDFWKLVTEYLPQLKDKIMARDGTLVIRPDSGDPVKILCGYKTPEFIVNYLSHVEAYEDAHYELLDCEVVKINDQWYRCEWVSEDDFEMDLSTAIPEHEVKGLIECLWDTFGGTINDKGYVQLDPHIGAIYGDSITLERQQQIIDRLMAKKFVPNVVLGIGSYTYQYVTRDTHGTAVKATSTQHGTGNHVPISKDPKTDSSKKSARGLLKVDYNEDGELVVFNDVTPEEEKQGLLITVFKDGKLVKETTLNEIRERLWG